MSKTSSDAEFWGRGAAPEGPLSVARVVGKLSSVEVCVCFLFFLLSDRKWSEVAERCIPALCGPLYLGRVSPSAAPLHAPHADRRTRADLLRTRRQTHL